MNRTTPLPTNTMAFLLPMLLLLACQPEKNGTETNPNRKTITKLQVKYASFFTNTITRVDCSDFDEEFREDTKLLTIEKDTFLAQFDQELQNLKPIDEHSRREPDARALLDIAYSDGSQQRVCLSLLVLKMDDTAYEVSESLRNLLIERNIIVITDHIKEC